MFPRLREQIGTALDLFVEFSTLGEYRLVAEAPLGASCAPTDAPGQAPQLGGARGNTLRAAVRRTVAGGPTGTAPVATPAARRLMEGREPGKARITRAPGPAPARSLPAGCQGDRRRAGEAPARSPRPRVRKGAAPTGEQLCFAV
jgi:hypothetical protein